MQRLQHEAVAAERDNDVGLLRVNMAVARNQRVARRDSFRRFIGEEGDSLKTNSGLHANGHGLSLQRESGTRKSGNLAVVAAPPVSVRAKCAHSSFARRSAKRKCAGTKRRSCFPDSIGSQNAPVASRPPVRQSLCSLFLCYKNKAAKCEMTRLRDQLVAVAGEQELRDLRKCPARAAPVENPDEIITAVGPVLRRGGCIA